LFYFQTLVILYTKENLPKSGAQVIFVWPSCPRRQTSAFDPFQLPTTRSIVLYITGSNNL